MIPDIPYDMATILNICGDTVNDEILDTYSEICTTFSDLEYIGHNTELDFIEIQLASQIMSIDEAVAAVNEAIYTASEEILAQLGISVDADISLPLLSKVLSAYGTFDPTEFPQTMLDIVDASADPIECCAEVLDFITAEDTSVWMNCLGEITPEFVSNIRYVLLQAIDDLPLVPLKIDREFNKRRKLVADAIPNTEMVGYTTECKNLGTYYERYARRFQELSNESAVRELVTLAAIAEDAPEKRLEALQSIIEAHIPDAEERIKYNGLINQTTRDLEHVIYR